MTKLCDMHYIVIENHLTHLTGILSLLKKIEIPSTNIWPSTPSTQGLIKSWEIAAERIQELRQAGFDPASKPIMVLLDILLTDEDAGAANLSEFQIQASSLDGYCKVVISQLVDIMSPTLAQYCHGQISKDLLAQKDSSEKLNSFRQKLEGAVRLWRRNDGASLVASRSVCRIDESLEWYLLESKFGQELVTDLYDILPDAGEIESVRALTAGYSGAGVVRVDYLQPSGQSRCVIAKISTDKDELQGELDKVRTAAISGGHFGARVIPSHDMGVRPLGSKNHAALYPAIEGKMLDDWLMAPPKGSKAKQTYKTLKESLSGFLLDCPSNREIASNPIHHFRLTDIDRARVHATLNTFVSYGKQLSNRDIDEAAHVSATEISKQIAVIADSWSDFVASVLNGSSLPVYEQHGDLHPRNILVQKDGSIRLIDLARFRVWPIFYDVARLELQLMRRLFDERNYGDWFPDRLVAWMKFWRSKTATNETHPCNSPCKDILATLKSVRKRIADEDRHTPDKVYELCQLFDILKMMSYQDMSIHKRFWFAAIGYEISLALMKRPNGKYNSAFIANRG